MELLDRIKTLTERLGADYFGVADLSSAHDFIARQGGEEVADFPRAVIIGMGLLDTLVDPLSRPDDRIAASLYRHHAYDVVNQMLDQTALQVANRIQHAGYQAFPIPASKRADDEHICGVFSQKLAAHLAGLGWIGKSCLLITPDRGPRVRWVSVLTDAPFTPSGMPMSSQCGDCTMCIDSCPVQAFTGRPFIENEPRETRFDAAAWDRYFRELEKNGMIAVCGICLYICPHGRKLR